MNLWSFTDRFVQEQKILFNVSPATLAWYRYSLKAFKPVLEAEFQSTPAFKVAVVARIADLQAEGRGNKAVSINTYLRCLKAFMAWAHVEQIVKEPFKLTWLKEEQKILSTFTPEHIRNLDVGGVRCSFHTLRHTFAVNYLQRAGNLEFLRRILGHSSILTIQKYLRSLGIEDLQAVHNGLSLLCK